MAWPLLSTSIGIAFISAWYLIHRLRVRASSIKRDAEANESAYIDVDAALPKNAIQLRTRLEAALPQCVISPKHAGKFKESTKVYWAQQACEVPPSCVVRPRDAEELSSAIKILKEEFDGQDKEDTEFRKHVGLFAVRSGGHSPTIGASSIKGGVLIDLSLFREITPASDGRSVIIGTGNKWIDVSNELQKKGLAVAGGRNSAVGVGGLALGGGISFFSPRYGMVCSSIIEYEIVLADGSIIEASAAENPDLWRALKGGANNFGIVTRFTVCSFPSTNIWSGFLYMHPSQASKVLSAFHEFLDRVITNSDGKSYDEHAAGPLACFSYVQQLGIQAIAVAQTYTKEPEDSKKWPLCWQTSGFSRLWRFWSTCGVKSLSAATDEMCVLDPPGRRQKFATTTVKNDAATLEAVHKAYRDAIAKIREHNIKKMAWTLVLQPFLPEWARKGYPNVLGLHDCPDDPLVNISFSVNWALAEHDARVQQITREAIEQIDAYAAQQGTGHRYRYINYCDSWQDPFEGYGEDNIRLMRDVSRKYDPHGLFQRACIGGFKLGL